MMTKHLASWVDGPSVSAIRTFVERVTTDGSPDVVEPSARVAVFDNDGTLWCEKPMPVELGFILQRLSSMAEADPALRTQQPWQAAYKHDYAWIGDVVTRHYQGDDSGVRDLMAAILKAFGGMTVDAYQKAAEDFLRQAPHPTLHRRLRDCVYAPMVELLRYLEAHGFVNYIASGGDRDFMRVVTADLYDIPSERVVGSSSALRYTDDHGGTLAYLAKPDVFDDGPVKPVRIWSRIGRRPLLAFGNSNGDLQMLEFAGGGATPALRLLLLHDDATREFAYTSGAEKALGAARTRGWTVVSMANAWTTVFGASAAASGK
jgi:phosphoserine phosphatase